LNQQTFEYIVAVAAIVITLSFLIQAAMMIGVYSSVKRLNRTADALQARAVPIINKIEPVVLQVQGTVSAVSTTVDKLSAQALDTFDKVAVEARAISAAVSVSSREIAGLATRQAEQLSVALDASTSMLHRQVSELDHLLTRTQHKIEATTHEVQSTVVTPLRELNALLAGIKRALELIFRGQRKEIDKAYQDEEMFI